MPITVNEDYAAKVEAFKLLGRLDSTGRKARQAFAQEMREPILVNVKKQSSIQDIYVEDPIPPGAQARYPTDITFDPSATDEFTGAAEDLDMEETSILGSSSKSQFLESDEIIIPRRRFEAEAGFDLDLALDGLFSWKDRLQEKVTEAITKQVESVGWTEVQRVAGHGSFPAAQKVSITTGQSGAGSFSKQLFTQMLKAQRDVGMIRNYPGASVVAFMSTQSLSEFEDWDVNTEGVSISVNGDLAERTKDAIVNVDPMSYDAEYRRVMLKSLTTLATDDVVADHDYIYMFLVTPSPKFFVRPVFAAPDGSRLQMMVDETAAYEDNSYRVKVRYREAYQCLDCRGLIVGDIDRS